MSKSPASGKVNWLMKVRLEKARQLSPLQRNDYFRLLSLWERLGEGRSQDKRKGVLFLSTANALTLTLSQRERELI